LADLLNDEYLSRESSNFSETLFRNAICEILNANITTVKVLTLYSFFIKKNSL